MSIRKRGGRGLRSKMATFGVAAAAVSAGVWLSRGLLEEQTSPASGQSANAAAQAMVRENLPKLPLSFEANRGQTDKAVNFVARGSRATMWLTDSEAVFGFSTDGKGADDVLRMQFVGAARPEVAGLVPQVAKSHYLKSGNDGIRNVPHFGEVAYKNLYPGVDVRWYGNRSKLEYDVTVAPGVDPSVVRMNMQGADEVKVNADGSLAVKIGEREIVQKAPVAYQTIDGASAPVAAAFEVTGTEVAFKLGAYDASRALVIDPAIDWSTYLGGAGDETVNRVAVDDVSATKGIVVCGGTNSIDFPLGYGHIPNAPKGSYDAYVSKLNPSGEFVIFSTYLAGADYDEAWGVAVDQGVTVAANKGRIWVTGQTWSSNFPTYIPVQAAKAGAASWDAFVVGMDRTGDNLLFSSYLGGSKNDYGRGIELDSFSYPHVTGFTNTDSLGPVLFPTTGGVQTTYGGGANDAFLTVYRPNFTIFKSTYLGGLGDDRAYDIAVMQGVAAPLDQVYIAGFTSSIDFPHSNVNNGINHTAQDGYGGGGSDAFLTRYTSGGTAIAWSTTWGGSGDDWANGVAVDNTNGDVAITGKTNSFDFPRVSAFQANRKGPDDAFVTKFEPNGELVDFSTYLGGKGSDVGNDLVINPVGLAGSPPNPFAGDVYVIGTTDSLDFPVTNDALQAQLSGGLNTDAWTARIGTFHNDFNIDQAGLVKFASYFGGTDFEYGNGIALASNPPSYNSKIILAGTTRSSLNFPYGPLPAFQTERHGASDGFVAKVSEAGPTLFPAGDVLAVARTPDSIAITWKNAVPDASDLVIDRIAADGAKTEVATVAPTTTQFVDTGLAADTTYNYTVSAHNNDGSKVQSEVVAASTLPYPPAAPTGLAAAVDGAKVSLTWADAATNETGYEIQRSTGGEFSTFATAKAGATRFETTQILTGEQNASWRVVAVNRGGSSAASNEVSATATPTLSVSVLSGTILDSAKSGADKFAASGRLAGAASFDPNTQSLRIELGTAAKPLVLSVPAGDRGWSVKRGVMSFNSVKSFVGGARFKLDLDARKGTFALTVTGFEFPAAVANPVSLGFAFGDKAGATSAVWTAKGAGKYSIK